MCTKVGFKVLIILKVNEIFVAVNRPENIKIPQKSDAKVRNNGIQTKLKGSKRINTFNF